MKIKIILYFIFLVLSESGFSQRVIEITSQPGQKGEVIFQAVNSDFCDYLVTLNFDRLANTNTSSSSSSVQVNVKPGTSQVYRITPLKLDQPATFSFKYTYIKGNSNAKMDESFLYLLPVKEGRTTRVDTVGNIRQLLGKPLSNDWYALSFSMNSGDTVFASRGGIVSQVNSGNSSPNTPVNYTRSTNSIEISHSDGSFARYDLLKNDGMLVKPGAKVNAGDPIAIIDKVYPRVYVAFMVYYLDRKKISTNSISPTSEYSSVKPKFVKDEKGGDYISSGETYSAIKPVNVITQEMTKREKEKFLTGNKK